MNQIKFILISLLVIVLIGGFYYIYSINRIKKVVQNPIIEISTNIIEINIDKGFQIHNPKSKIRSEYKWSDFESIILTNEKKIDFKYNSQIILELHKSKTNNWHEIILSIPKEIKMNSALESEKIKIKNQLSSCQICGRVAVFSNNCLNCGNLSVEKHSLEYGKYQSSEEYIKENQEYWLRQENGEIDLNFDEPNVFKRDENWKIKIK